MATKTSTAKKKRTATKKAPAPATTKPKKSFHILDVPDVSEWERVKNLPRAMQPMAHEVMPCTDCGGHCCGLQVIVSGVEMLPIVFALRARLETLVEPALHDAADTVRRPAPFVLDDAAHGRGEFQLRLKRGANGLCSMAFAPGGKVGRCGVWAMRPGNCRIYPFRVEVDGATFRVGDQLLCPTRWLQDDAMRASTERDARAWLKDLAVEERVVEAWNARGGPRTFDAYVAYLFDEVAPELGFDRRAFDRPEKPRAFGKKLW